MTRVEQVCALLRFYGDMVDPTADRRPSAENARKRPGYAPDPVLDDVRLWAPERCMPAAYSRTARELERCLRAMRADTSRLEPHGHSPRLLWSHVYKRYLGMEVRRMRVVFKDKRAVLPPHHCLFGDPPAKARGDVRRRGAHWEWRTVERWSEWTDLALVELGVEHLAGLMFDGKPLFLPKELVDAVAA